MPTPPTPIDDWPEAPSIDDIDNFEVDADPWVGAMQPRTTQMNALAANVYANALEAETAAGAAGEAQEGAETAQGLTEEARDTAVAAAGVSTTKAGEAATSAIAAANAAAGAAFTATSTTSNSIGGGSKTWAVGTGLSYQAGLFVVVSDGSDPSNYCHGQVAAYTGGNLTVDVTTSEGSGTYTDWDIGLSGPEGPAASLPAGLISMWSGSIASIPAGWALCDGSSGTPDLRSKFLVGASASGGYAVGATGGATSDTPTITVNNHTLTTAEMPSHTHSFVTQGGGGGGYVGLNAALGYYNPGDSFATGGGGAHNHTATSSAVSTLPPYYALAFIMKL